MDDLTAERFLVDELPPVEWRQLLRHTLNGHVRRDARGRWIVRVWTANGYHHRRVPQGAVSARGVAELTDGGWVVEDEHGRLRPTDRARRWQEVHG